ncbi:sigma-70 family RNA polymerase sigma factor [Miniphocaeibacter massiliensis]|uniref:sigma-70 family RNA polymerase sigma factor n=1 Tax=Miniphocaeibacter massiliensis TaxID=2041841 RepID=UPI000C1C2F7A|nr:sigma-70 family RNA polymerase sigma factor [Miniphocaeibacter massiliensis]
MEKRYLEIQGKEVEVSEEVYKAYMQPVWKEKKRIQRAYKNLEELGEKETIKLSKSKNNEYVQVASIEDGFTNNKPLGLPLSLERAEEEAGFEIVSKINIEEVAMFNLLKEALYEVLSEFQERDQKIMELLLIYEMKEREVAKEVRCSQKTVNNVKNKLLPIIQEKMEDWRD